MRRAFRLNGLLERIRMHNEAGRAQLLDQFIDKPELASVLRTEERIGTIKALSALLSGPNPIGGNEVEEIRKIAGKARSRIVG